VRHARQARILGALILVWTAACGEPGEASPAKGGEGAAAAAKGSGGPGGPGGAGARPPTILGATDVIDVKPGTIEEGLTISGDLRPIEVIDVRSRVEGNIVGVYAREGDRVGRGQVLARFESSVQESERTSAVADQEAAKADVANAQWNADQSEELFKAGAIPERDLRTAQQTLIAAKARLASAEARVRAMTQSEQDTRVVSPTTGVVSARSIENGEHVTRGATMFTVVRNDILELEAALPARQAGDLRPGQTVRFDAGGRRLEGKVARIAPTINPSNRTISVYLQVPNRNGELKGNTFVTGRVVARTITDALLVPTVAIRQSQDGKEPFVYRIVNQTVDIAPVEVGVVDDVAGMAQIVRGIAAGDRVIVGNIGVLGRGMPVRVVGDEQPTAK
jgi:membrane fusion protein (multidrug efflux system)